MPLPLSPPSPSLSDRAPLAVRDANVAGAKQKDGIKRRDGSNTDPEGDQEIEEIVDDARESSIAAPTSYSTDGQTALKRTTEIPLPLPRPSRTSSAKAPNQALKKSSDDAMQSQEGSSSQASPQIPGLEVEEPNTPVHIPKIPPISSGVRLPPNLAQLATGLDGKSVDEFGNILDWNGQVLGRVEGDLPSMVGRCVSTTGEIISEDGEVVGYVAENDTLPPAPPPPQPIEGMLGGGLKVDHMGNILDNNGSVIGHFNAAPLAETAKTTRDEGTGSTTRQNSGTSKSAATPSPSEIFLDVKSTNDGIQLIIKIPTVFNNGGRPAVHIS